MATVRGVSPDADLPRRVRGVLDAAGYSDEGILEVLGGEELGSLGGRRVPALLRRTAGGSALETLVRLFVVGVDVDEVAARRAIAPMDLADWVALGLVVPHDGRVRAALTLRCYQGLVVASDFRRPEPGRGLPPDYVMGITPSTLSLAALTVRRPVVATLDVGTGCGFQAFLAAQHSERVVGTDANPRAVQVAELNAALNGLGTVSCRLGDLFEPVAGERFALIVSNPPFIVSPGATHQFLSTDRPGDVLCQQLARAAPSHLLDGGWCQFLCNWVEPADGTWESRLAGWFEGTGCDAWVMRRASQPADEYACEWIETNTDEPAEFARRFDEWMATYEELGIAGIGFGLVTMRRREGTNWFRIDDAPETLGFPAGDDIGRLFDRADVLTFADDASLLEMCFRLPAEVHMVQECRPGRDEWEVISAEVRRTGGLGYSGSIDPAGARLLARCDGHRSLRTLLAEIVAETDASLTDVEASSVAIVRRLVERGLLEPT